MKEKKPRNQNLTIPNLMSLLRIIIVPFFAYFFLNDQLFIAVTLIVISGLSDLFDGMIARKFNQVTELGKMLDPLADKITQGVISICIAVKIPIICPILALFIIKELLMLVLAVRLLKAKKRPCAAQWYGKTATVMFYVSVSIIVIMNAFIDVPTQTFYMVSCVMLVITAAMMCYAAVRYFGIYKKLMESNDEKDTLNINDEMKTKIIREKEKR